MLDDRPSGGSTGLADLAVGDGQNFAPAAAPLKPPTPEMIARLDRWAKSPNIAIEVDPDTGARLPPGQPGEIVLTTLRNQAMPLLRYRTGDLGRMLDGPCRCGGVLPRLDRVEGRREGRLPLPGGASLSIHQLDEIVFARPEVRAFEAEVTGSHHLRLTVDSSRPLDPGDLAARLPAGLAWELCYREVNPFARRAKRRLRTT